MKLKVKLSFGRTLGGDYNKLVNRPWINGVEVIGAKSAEDYGLATIAYVDSSSRIVDVYQVNGQTQTIVNRVLNLDITKFTVDLGNVDNTSDMDKPVSTLQQEALDTKLDKSVVAVPATPNTVARRHGDGRLYVGAPTENYDAATKKYVDDIAKDKLDITGGSVTGDLAVQGDLTVSGTTTTEHQKQLLVEDNVIVTNANKIDLQSLLSGIAINKNPIATYGIMYDPSDDTVKFGQGTLDENNKFVFNTEEGLPIAIRAQASDFTDAHLVKWDATKNAFVDAGYTGDDIASKTNVTVNGEHVDTFNADTKLDKVSGSDNTYKIYGTDNNGNNILWKLTYFPQVGTIPVVNSNRTITVDPAYNFSALKDSDAINKKYVDNTISSATSITILEASDA